MKILKLLNIALLIFPASYLAVSGIAMGVIGIYSVVTGDLDFTIQTIASIAWMTGGITGFAGVLLFVLEKWPNLTHWLLLWGLASYGYFFYSRYLNGIIAAPDYYLNYLWGIPLLIGLLDIKINKSRLSSPRLD